MSETVKTLQEKLQNDSELRKQIGEEMERMAQSGMAATPDEALMKAAKTVLNLDISLSDLEKARAEKEELDPEELTSVSGGEHARFCNKDYWCHIVYHHDKDDKDAACWWNYVCFGIYYCTKAAN